MLKGYEKISFLHLPTPLEYLPRVSEELGIKLYIKRDDLTNLGTGGNKLRKLEYFLHDALQKGATALVTVGGIQTNHGRLIAAVAAKYGLKCTIVTVGKDPGELSGNLLLDRIMGSEVVIVEPDGKHKESELEKIYADEAMRRYKDAGEEPYFVPLGGSNELGILGYRECAKELADQAKELNLHDPRVIVTAGSLGTYMGLFIGFGEIEDASRLTAVCISPSCDPAPAKRALRYFRRCKDFFGLDWDAGEEDFHMTNSYHYGAYNNPVAEVRESVYHMARKEGIILDPCYTGKTYNAIRLMVHNGEIEQGETIIFIHTGGVPGINGPIHRKPMEEELMDGVSIVRAGR
ncbi:MAG TPA: pyridoxal-phosphate dependent enzyme [Bacillota bacterium]|nr:pyridoxal-phosphate dependent enzyme [Bacillota bacterium]HQC35680.1 pyridoxal-phosphate dependent enzyme [Bacillota bacterium]